MGYNKLKTLEWTSMKDRLPLENEEDFVYDKMRGMVMVAYRDHMGSWKTAQFGGMITPLCWRVIEYPKYPSAELMRG